MSHAPSNERDEAVARRRGPLAYMANNHVAANLIMLVLLLGGLLMAGRVKQEVFPEFDLDIITVSLLYLGASPAEVEQGVILPLEEAVQGIDGVKDVRSTSAEGVGSVVIELLLGADADQALSDVRSAVDRITSFPAEAERPVISLLSNRNQVVSLVIYGDLSEQTLRDLANRARDDLLQDERITLVDIDGVRPLEISIEVPQENLRRYGLTLNQIAAAVSLGSVELPGGAIETEAGEVLVRTTERRDYGEQYERLALLSQPDGSRVTVGDLAVVRDGFRDTDQEAFFNGQRAVRVNVYRVGDQTPIEISDAVKEYVERQEDVWPEAVGLALWNDSSEIYRDRIALLLRNAYLGLALVLLVLGLFLEVRLAFWVTMGIPISFLGGVMLMPTMDVSLNMISLFAFILMLGVVVDDAIVVGEAVYHKRQLGYRRLDAAIIGVREVAGPVVFAVLTTMMAFMPLFFVPGASGKFFRVIPAVVLAVLLISLIESLIILPAHLAFSKRPSQKGVLGWIHHRQEAFANLLERFVEAVFRPLITLSIRWRYATLGLGIATVILVMGWVAGGGLQFTFMPKIETDVITAQLQMPFGTPVAETRRWGRLLSETAEEVFAELGGEDRYSRGIFAQVGEMPGEMSGPGAGLGGNAGSHLGQVAVFLVAAAERDFGSAEFARRWRERVGEIPGAEVLSFNYAIRSAGSPIDLELSHSDVGVLEGAAERLAGMLGEYAGVTDIDDGFSVGKEQLDVTLRPEGRSLGVTETDLAQQLRASYFGVEAVRQQRGRDELRVYVRLPESERRSEYDFEELIVQTPGGGELPLAQAANVERGSSYTEIRRRNGRRVMNVRADIDDQVTNANEVIGRLRETELPVLVTQTPGLTWDFGGEQQQQQESLDALGKGAIFALLAMFALMAIALKSYVQPFVIMTAIPFGVVGAVIGHVIMGFDLSLISMLGIVALAGIVVNDSIILVAAVNDFRGEGMAVNEALVAAGTRRFRPIMLTSLTTFFGLFPMILETSVQARFLVPMAISLGFGVLFATFITLFIVPVNYAIIEDLKRIGGGIRAFLGAGDEDESPPELREAQAGGE